jgi:hypothetical protein
VVESYAVNQSSSMGSVVARRSSCVVAAWSSWLWRERACWLSHDSPSCCRHFKTEANVKLPRHLFNNTIRHL